MRKSFVVIAVALVAAAIPSGATVVGLGSLAAVVALLAPSQAAANTAVLPGWRHPCGRNPRCMERVEGRRLDRLRARSGTSSVQW